MSANTTFVLTSLQARAPVVDTRTGVLTKIWLYLFQGLSTQVQALQVIANSTFGTNLFTLANQPTLGSSDAGYVGFVTDYAHLVYWDGSAWQWLDGDLPGRLAFWSSAPATGWGLCDGTSVDLLTIGATLTTTAFTTPNLKGTAAYLKSGSAFSATVQPASGTTASGSTGTGTTGGGTTGTGTTGTGTTGTGTTGVPDATVLVNSGSGVYAAGTTHTHSIPGLTVPGLSVPGLSIPGLSIPGLSVPSLTVAGLGVGTLDTPHVVGPVYVRR